MQRQFVKVTFNKKSLDDKDNMHQSKSLHNNTIYGGEPIVPMQNGDKKQQVLMILNFARGQPAAKEFGEYLDLHGILLVFDYINSVACVEPRKMSGYVLLIFGS
ncbi:hypothetical protein CAEBREN_20406 [Caenorhabditis brenneri]|uniref:Uncharacterized protein n=1 Tax=Caenorhabditis brenneri TaxID=135651 RepID=G0NI33_CAEBE|nr:hypothetical protein CAEBREN_20406 [Caenorhabditis brenneri]